MQGAQERGFAAPHGTVQNEVLAARKPLGDPCPKGPRAPLVERHTRIAQRPGRRSVGNAVARTAPGAHCCDRGQRVSKPAPRTARIAA